MASQNKSVSASWSGATDTSACVVKVVVDRPKAQSSSEQAAELRRLEHVCLHQKTAVTQDGQMYTFLDGQPWMPLNSGHDIPLVCLGTWYAPIRVARRRMAIACRGHRHSGPELTTHSDGV